MTVFFHILIKTKYVCRDMFMQYTLMRTAAYINNHLTVL